MRARYASTTSVGERRLAWMAAESSCTMKEVGSLWGIGGFAVEGGGMAGQEPRQAMASNPQRRSRDLLRGRGYDIHTLKVGGAHLPPPAREASGGGGRPRRRPRRGGGGVLPPQ